METMVRLDSLFKGEPRTHSIFQPIHLASNDTEQRSRVHQDLDAVLLHNLIEFLHRVDRKVTQVVRQSGTSTVTNADSQ